MAPSAPGITFLLLGGQQAAEHASELQELHAEVYAEPPYRRDDDADQFARRFAVQRRQPGFVLAEARHGGYLVGYAAGMPLRPSTSWWRDLTAPLPAGVTAEHPGRTFALADLLVRASWRRQGIARALHDLLLADRPEERATLTVLPAAAAAQHAFRAWGWRRVARARGPGPGSPICDVLLATLPLGPSTTPTTTLLCGRLRQRPHSYVAAGANDHKRRRLGCQDWDMELRIFTEPQEGADYATLLSVAQATERLGFDAFFRSDHYLTMSGSGLPGPTDAWITLAGLARDTSRIRLGTLVTPVTFRRPGPLAITVAQVDQMSGGRAELGLGTGWFDAEHTAYGIPFPPVGERFARLEEQLEIITGLWETPVGETFSFDGTYYTLSGSPALPKPAQRPRPPVLVGGGGPARTPRLAARFADEYNIPFATLEDSVAAFRRVREACQEAGRDPGSLRYSAAQTVCCGRDEAELARRAQAIGEGVDDLRHGGLAGSPAEIVDKLGRFADAGAARAYLQVLDLHDLDHLELIAAEVMPQVR